MIVKKFKLTNTILLSIVIILFATRCSSKHTAEEYYKKGIELFREKKYAKANSNFQQAIALNPNFGKAYFKLIEIYKIERNLDAAIGYFRELIKTHPQVSFPYYAIGTIQVEKDDYSLAIENYKKTIQLQPQFPEVYAAIPKTYLKLGNLTDAMKLFEQQISLDPNSHYLYYGLAYAYSLQFDWESSLEMIGNTLRLQDNAFYELLLKMNVLSNQGKYKGSIQIGLEALRISQEKGDVEHQCAFFNEIGSNYYLLGEYDDAAENLQEALKLSQKIGNKEIETRALNGLGSIARHRGEFSDAFEYLTQAKKISKEIMDENHMGIISKNIGDVHMESGQYEEALVNYEDALKIFGESGNEIDEADVYGAMASVFGYTGQYDKEVEFRKKAIKIYQEVNQKSGLSNELGNLGASYLEQGLFQKGLEYSQQGLSLAIEIDDKYKQQKFLANVGIAYYFTGIYDKATRYLEESYEIAYQIGEKTGAAATLMNMGGINYEIGDTLQALQNFEKAYPVFREAGDPKGEAIAVANISSIYTEQKKFDKALEYMLKALEIDQRIKNPYGEADTYNGLGSLYFKLGQYDNAIDAHKRALAIAEKLQAVRIIWESAYNLGKVYEQKGDFASAVDYYKLAINKIESVREQILASEQKSTFLANKIEPYERLINALFELNRKNPSKKYSAEAFHFAERAKARTLLDILAESNIEIEEGVDSTLLKHEQEIFQNITRIQTKQHSQSLSEEQLETLADSLLSEEDLLRNLRIELKKKSPAYSELKYPNPLTVDQIQKLVISEDEMLLEYFLSSDRSYLWAITKNEIQIHQLPSEAKIKEAVDQYLSVISKPPQIGTSPQASGEKLYDMLLAPAKDVMQSDMIIVPDGILHYLPFEALILNDGNENPQYLGESFRVSYAPSASVLGFIEDRSKEKDQEYTNKLLAFGNPLFKDVQQLASVNPASAAGSKVRGSYIQSGFEFSPLPYSANEIESLIKLYDADRIKIYLKNDAVEENLKSEVLSQYRIIHFATHALIDEEHPGRSCIVLTIDDDPKEDGLVQMNEIFNMQMDADLVTLSACQTGGGKLVRGEGIVGLTRAFFYAGAHSVLVSLWPVNDQSTTKLMEKFYSYLQQGKGKTEALRLAKTDLISGENRTLRHPYFWAPFVLIGENN